MNVVLETLYLRRPRIEYVSPPVCPIVFSASGVAIFDQCFNDLVYCSGQKINTNFLNFQQPPDGLAYNVYYSTQQTGQPFQLVNDGLPPGMSVVFTAGTYYFTVNTAAGESIPFPPYVAPGGVYTRIPVPLIPGAISFNLYKDGVKIISGMTGVVVESSAQGWYQATKITMDGETPLSGCSALLLSGTVPAPPPPPPPPPPGPAWTTFSVITPVCNNCIGSIISGIPNCSGGFTAGANFSMSTSMIGGNPAIEYIFNNSGVARGNYTGPIAHCLLTLASSTNGGAIFSNNTVQVLVNTVPVLQIYGSNVYINGSYDFYVPAGTGEIIDVLIQGEARGAQTLNVAGAITNIP
jgi:hypothetical protein